jgi:hypothetical protein
MAAGGMAAGDHGARWLATMQEQAGGAQIGDDVGQADLGAEPVAWHRDRKAARIRAGRHVAEQRWLKAAQYPP